MFVCRLYIKKQPRKLLKELMPKGLRLIEKIRKRKRAEESQQQLQNRLAANRESMKRKRGEESQQQRENRLASQREITKRKRAEESQEQPKTTWTARVKTYQN